MRKLFWLIVVLFPLVACQSMGGSRAKKWKSWMEDNGKLKVLTTTAMISEVVKGVGGEHVDVMPLIDGELDPHSYEPVKGDQEKFDRADVIFFNGLGLEHGPSLEKFLIDSPKAHAVGDAVMKKSPEKILYMDGAIDPHIWMDMSLWGETIDPIQDVLSKNLQDKSKSLEANADSLKSSFKKLHTSYIQAFDHLPKEKRYLVTSHDAFGYFTKAYLATDDERDKDSWRIRCQAPEGLAPEGQLSAADIRHIVDHLKKYHICVIFPESNVSADALKKIMDVAQEEGLEVSLVKEPLYGDSMGDGSYEEMISHNVNTISKQLEKNGQ